MKIGHIYKIENKINGKLYIGQSFNVDKRWRAHVYKNTTSAIHQSIVKYGKDNFNFEIICSSKNIDDLNWLEQYFIAKYNTMTPNGYNLDQGGRNCPKTKESIEKGAIKKRGMAYKNRRRGIIATHSITNEVIEVEVVKDFLKYGFSLANCSNIRTVLAKKSKRKKVRDYYFRYKNDVNQNLIDNPKKLSAVQRIGIETASAE